MPQDGYVRYQLRGCRRQPEPEVESELPVQAIPLPGAEEIGVLVSFIEPESCVIVVQKESSVSNRMVEKMIEEKGGEAMESDPASSRETD